MIMKKGTGFFAGVSEKYGMASDRLILLFAGRIVTADS